MTKRAFVAGYMFVAVCCGVLPAALAAGNKSISKDGKADTVKGAFEYPAEAIEHYNRGVDEIAKGSFGVAQSHLEAALKIQEYFPEAHNNLGFALRKQGEAHWEGAMEHYNRGIEIAPDLPEPYMYRGVLFVQKGQYEFAEADYARLKAIGTADARSLAKKLRKVIKKGPEAESGLYGTSKRLKK